jgi:hypothetical protein
MGAINMIKWLRWGRKEGTQHRDEFQMNIALKLMEELADDLEARIRARYKDLPEYFPEQKRNFQRDMNIVWETRKFIESQGDIEMRIDRTLERMHKIARSL